MGRGRTPADDVNVDQAYVHVFWYSGLYKAVTRKDNMYKLNLQGDVFASDPEAVLGTGAEAVSVC